MWLRYVFANAMLQSLAWCDGSPGLCTNVSLSYPGWEVSSFLLADDRVDVQLVNNARPGSSIGCSGDQHTSSSSYGCNDSQTMFMYEGGSAVLAVNQTWTCDDTNLTFVGIGNATLDCPSTDAASCSVGPKTIRASLLAPVAITPESVRVPPEAQKQGCTRKSRSPSFEVSNLFYQRLEFGVPCGPVATNCPAAPLYHGIVEFDLVNTATGNSSHCSVTTLALSDLMTTYADLQENWFPCDGGLIFINPVPEAAKDAKHRSIISSFRLNHTSNSLEVKQTWYCNDQGDHDEYEFTAYGVVSPALDPTLDYVGNMTDPQVRVGAASPAVTVPGSVVEEKLPPNALERQQVFGRSCTVTSLVSPPTSLRISDFEFSTYWKDKWDKSPPTVRTSYVFMYVTNWMFNIELTFNSEGEALTPGVPGVSDPSRWYGCNGGLFTALEGSPLLNCSFAFDRTSGRLSVREDWICADKDGDEP